VEAGGKLLSDESVMLLPSGVHGTPFFSSARMGGECSKAPLRALVTLRKGMMEAIQRLPGVQAEACVLQETYRPPPGEGTAVALIRRVAELLSGSGGWQLTFRKDAAAGVFVRDWIHEIVQAPHFA